MSLAIAEPGGCIAGAPPGGDAEAHHKTGFYPAKKQDSRQRSDQVGDPGRVRLSISVSYATKSSFQIVMHISILQPAWLQCSVTLSKLPVIYTKAVR